MHRLAIAFDFDGTLIRNGIDKVPYALYAAYAALHGSALRRLLQPDEPGKDIEQMRAALMALPGAPRFQQLAAMVNAVVPDLAESSPDSRMSTEYAKVKSRFNFIYSELNDYANEHFWHPFPAIHKVLPELAETCDLFVASGVTQSILESDMSRHNLDPRWFQAVMGADESGGADKQELLERIRQRGYSNVIFVADAHKDQEYARLAGVRFLRIRRDEDFFRLRDAVRGGLLPDERKSWTWNDDEIAFVRLKTTHMVECLRAGNPLSIPVASAWVSGLSESVE